MGTKKETGDKGENIACAFLESKGYFIIKKNFRAARCEIDIIARKDEYIIFVEVKTRKTQKFGNAALAVGAQKQKNIITAAEIFIASDFESGLDSGSLYENMQPRFDIVEVYVDEKNKKNYINHIEFAFIT